MKIQHQLYVLILVLSFAISCTSETERSDQSKKVERAQEQIEQSIKKEVKTTVPLAQPKKVENKPKLFSGVQILRDVINIRSIQYKIGKLQEQGDTVNLKKQDSIYSNYLSQLDRYLKTLPAENPDYDVENDWFLAFSIESLNMDTIDYLITKNDIKIQRNPEIPLFNKIANTTNKSYGVWRIWTKSQNGDKEDVLVHPDARYAWQLTEIEANTIGIGLYSFRSRDMFEFDNQIFAYLINNHSKTSYFIGTVWERKDSLELKVVFDSHIMGDIGCGLIMDSIVNITEDESVIICNIDGSGTGECGGSLWMGKWTKPNSLERVYWKYYRELYLPYKVDITEDLNVQVYEPNRQKTVVDEFNLKDLLTDKRIYTED